MKPADSFRSWCAMSVEANRVALITGAARGIGAATVRRLVNSGYAVVAVDLGDAPRPAGVAYELSSGADLERLAAEHGGAVIPYVADVRDAQALRAAAEVAMERFGRLDVAVACAAVMIGGAPLWDTPEPELRTLLDIDVVGVWNLAAATVPHMLTAPDPSTCRFVAVASAAGERGLYLLAGYSTAKHAVIGIVRGLAADLVGTGITAVAVSPGSTDTAMLQATADIYRTTTTELAHSQLLQRTITPDEIAAVIELCCSIEGAALNGSVVGAAGGFVG